MWNEFLVLFASLVLRQCWAHTLSLGACPTVAPMADFDLDKFLGKWYVIQKSATISSCMEYNIFIGTDGKLRLLQSGEKKLLNAIRIHNKYNYTGVLSIPDYSIPAKMHINFPLINVAREADFVVFMTDYESYAATVTCQRIVLSHVKVVSILSRKPFLDRDDIILIHKHLKEAGISPHDLTNIDQYNCLHSEEAKLNLNINDKTFTLGGITNAVHEARSAVGNTLDRAGKAVRQGVGKVGEWAGTGVQKVTDLIGSGFNLFSRKEKKPIYDLDVRTLDIDNQWLP